MSITDEIKKVEAKIENLRFRLAVEEKVLSHLQAIENPHSSSVKTWSQRKFRKGSLASNVEHLLKEVNRPMKVSEIAKELESRGVTTNSKYGLGPMVASAVRKTDVFTRLSRGMYCLKNQKKEVQQTLLE